MMMLPLTAALALAVIATESFARTYQPIPPMEPQILLPEPDGLYRNTPPVLDPGSEEVSTEYRANRIWQQYNRSVYGLSAAQAKFDRDTGDDSQAFLLDDYRYERQRMRKQHQYHAYRHKVETQVYVVQPQVYHPNYSNYWW
jgi:hypothetical protein